MIYGIGTDIAKVSRFEKWANNTALITRFFNEAEQWHGKPGVQGACEHYAARFAAKEAFAKALGTGFKDFSLKEICVKNSTTGKPELFVYGNALEAKNRNGADKIHLSLSHESEYTIAMVILEKTGD